ncbi:AMP-binding protein [Janthinobacterium sp. PC23-8]|uniref:AMP-binding protein n=1 Tax=Janthinobacterium sp. PC23-8 TaxID=2012679 RepID=UPI000B9782B4|nr:AMP-binding protein [Janthinobacterium sp. PC23-8]OYO26309.1 acyl-CoA synthetase [Janthinobacterium sp. PC23-8]
MTTNHVHASPTVGAWTLRVLARHPAATAFAWDGGTLSYAAAAQLIGRMQAVLSGAGLCRPDRVALLSANRADVWCAGVAVQALGMSTVWLHPLGALPDQLGQLDQVEADALIVDIASFGARGAEIAARTARLRHVFTLGPSDFGIDLLAAAEQMGDCPARDLAQPDDIATLTFTGGTTGKSKAGVRDHGSMAAIFTTVLSDFDLPATPRFLVNAPISHVAGSMVLPVLARGGTVHLARGFEPERELAYIQRERINAMLLVPTMIYALLDHPALDQTDLSCLEILYYGASPMAPARLLEGIERIGPVFAQFYGQTECYPITVLPRRDHDPQRPELFHACGFPATGVDVRLVDADDRPVGTGEAGEICVRAPSVIREYWGQPELTATAMRDGWLHTGDVARMDAEGRLYIVDRRSDLIITGGFNVYPREVEDALATHCAVAMSAVFGVPHERWGEAVTAFVVRRPESEVSEEDLIDWVRQMKGKVYAPKRLVFVAELPLTSVGKIDKKQLRAAALGTVS